MDFDITKHKTYRKCTHEIYDDDDDGHTVCRLCGRVDDATIGIYSEEGLANDLESKIVKYLPIKVSKDDRLSLQCCRDCTSTLLTWHRLFVDCVETNRRLNDVEIVNQDLRKPTNCTKEEEEFDDDEDFDEILPKELMVDDRTSQQTTNDLRRVVFDEIYDAELKEIVAVDCNEVTRDLAVSVDVSVVDCHAETVAVPGTTLVIANDDITLLDVANDVNDQVTPKEEEDELDKEADKYLDNYLWDDVNVAETDEKIIEVKTTKVKTKKVEAAKLKTRKTGAAKVKTKKVEAAKVKTKKAEALAAEGNRTEAFAIEANRSVAFVGVTIETEAFVAETNRAEVIEAKTFECDYCSLILPNDNELYEHIRLEHVTTEDDDDEEETKTRKSTKSYKLDRELIDSAKVVIDGRVYYNCKICGKSLYSPYTYTWHTRIHTGERPYVCDLCGKQFRVSQGLVRHLKETHEGIKKFPCDLCGRKFATKRNVEEHRRIHTNERPYVCDLCGKSFKQKASLFVHNRSHTNHFPYRCTYCDQGFRTRPTLLLHVTRHTGEKPYPCDVCGRCFRIKYELKRHKLIHSDVKPFSCNECGLKFRQKRYLRNHNKSNHNRNTDM